MDYRHVMETDPELFKAIADEVERQREHIELIASENFVSPAVMEAMGSPLTNKYAEGYPAKRYYGGCQYVDVAENLARDRAKLLFGAEHANVQPHSGAQANTAVYFAMLNPGDTVLGMNLSHGGHLTHGSPVNISGKYFHFIPYGVDESDRSPKEMQLLDDRLQTRFEWGLLVDVQPPDFETRLAIVKNKAAQWGTVIDDDIARYIAENVTSNVRQLEGTMNKILAYRDLIGREMDADAAHRAVEDFMKKNANLAPTAAMIITETSRYFGIDEEVIKGPSRSREAVNARQAAMYLVRRMTNLSTPDIGREFGKRDHTTVLHSLEQIEKKMKSDPVFNQTIKEITININSKR